MNQIFFVLCKSKNIGSSCGDYSNWVIKDLLSVHYSIEDVERAIEFQEEYYPLERDEKLQYFRVECPDV